MFHISACSLNKNFDDLEYLLKCTKRKFDSTPSESSEEEH